MRQTPGCRNATASSALVALAAGVASASKSSWGPGAAAAGSLAVSASGSPAPGVDAGSVVYQDTFAAGSDWFVGTQPSGTKWSLSGAGYVALPVGNRSHYMQPPYATPLPSLTVRVTGTETGGTTLGSGFGVFCLAGSGGDGYEFLLGANGHAVISIFRNNTPSTLASVPTGAALGQAHTVQAGCITESTSAGTAQVRLLMWVDGTVVMDREHTWPSFPGGQWLTAVSAADGATSAGEQVTFTDFSVRRLSA